MKGKAMSPGPETVDVTMAEVLKNASIGIRLRGCRRAMWRFWIGFRLLRFACWVIPIDTFIDMYGGDDSEEECT